ncbi:MAG: protein translocase subunit SecD [Myxococcota bacterium]|nr:protein translocase subunit SecD [Myxococcota bacterium]
MSGAWWTRVVIIFLAVVWGAWMLIPTIIAPSAAERAAASAEELNNASSGTEGEAEVEEPEEWWDSLLPAAQLSLGLDLQGGIDMTLQVEVAEAVISSVQRDIAPLKDTAENEGIFLGNVRRATGEPTLLFQVTEDFTLGELTAFMEKKFAGYEYANSRDGVDGEQYAFTVTEVESQGIRERAVEQALETLRSRIDETGVKEPSIVLKGGNRINIQLPGIDDPETAINAIGTAAVLEFMLVDEDVMKQEGDILRGILDAETELAPEIFVDDEALSEHLRQNGIIPSNTLLMWEYSKDVETKKDARTERFFVLKDEIILTGDDINDASVAIDQYNQPYTALEFKPRGGKIFADVTGENVGRRFAIVLDNKISSAPNIREKIGGGRASIESGVNDYNLALQEASVLSLVLRTGALPAPVTIGEIRQVGASLGEDAIEAGKQATVVGFGLVLAFMVVYYRKAGMVSVIALMSNILLVFALLAGAGATLTLPGIAGIALTIGMAVDCNIIIYERIREELRLGKNARAAVGTGFDKALLAVLDANITTFIAGVVLYTYGTGPIKGFAVTLMIGIITTLFTGIFVSRTMMDFLTRKATSRLSI